MSAKLKKVILCRSSIKFRPWIKIITLHSIKFCDFHIYSKLEILYYMGIYFRRKKKRNWILSISYKIKKILPLNTSFKFKLFLNLEWIFNRFAHELSNKYYEVADHPFRSYSLKCIMNHISEDHNVLDLGCKYGEISRTIAIKANRVVGIDYDKNAIKVASKQNNPSNLSFLCIDAHEYLQVNNYKFDVLILSHVLEHIDNPINFLQKYAPHFKHIYIEVPDFEASYLNIYRKELGMSLIYTDADHVSEFDRCDLNKIVEKIGFEVVFAEYRFGIQRLWCNNRTFKNSE